MWKQHTEPREMKQILQVGNIHQERLSSADTDFANTGRCLYVTGNIDGRFRPSSNPYDIYAFGKPDPHDPLANKLQGVWGQPVKGFSGYGFTLQIDGTTWELNDAVQFTQTFASASFAFQRENLHAERHDFVPLDLPLLFTSLRLENTGSTAINLRLTFHVLFDLEDAWFTSLAQRRNTGETLTIEGQYLVARAEVLPEAWAAAVVGEQIGAVLRLSEGSRGEILYELTLPAGTAQTYHFAMSVVSAGGVAAAINALQDALPRRADLLREKEQHYRRLLENGPRLVSPDPDLNAAFTLALANLQMLEAETGGMGRYFYAGLEMFPFWFSNDGAYSVPCLLAAGVVETALNHIRIGLSHLENGCVPHQISPSGTTAFKGNAEETPLWVLSIWDAYRWTGRLDFLTELYPGAVQGLLTYTLQTIDPDHDSYASGPGMVEVSGMGEEKLDTVAYTWLALKALVEMAEIQGDASTVQQVRQHIARIESNFERDWWDAEAQTYSMSLDAQNRQFPVPHWAIITPLEVGLAAPDHARQTFAVLSAQYLNEWGLKHTAGEDERVWTLPTATLSRAAYRYGESDLGFTMLRHIAETLHHGPIGLFHELIPQGACFVQLWSAGTFLRGIVEDLFGLSVRADRHELRITPQLPTHWQSARLENLSFAGHTITIELRQGQQPHITPIAGQQLNLSF